MPSRRNIYLCCLYIGVTSMIVMSCSISRQYKSNAGIVTYLTRFYNKDSGKYLLSEEYGPGVKLWYKDSVAIIRNMAIEIEDDTNYIEKRRVYVLNYIYIDLPGKMFYRYASFTDTSKIIDSYSLAEEDTVNWGVTWKFYRWNEMPHTEPLLKLNDTVIDNIPYQRMKIVDYTKNDSIDKRVIIAYFDCARKGTMFTINRQLSQIVNCPLVKLQTQPSEKYKSAIAGEIEFTSDKLSTEELRIFNAWEKNAKKYLAKK